MTQRSPLMLRLKSPGSRWLILIAGLIAAGTMAAISAVIGAYYYVAPGLPAADTIRQIPLQIPLRIFSRDGRLIEEVGERRRVLVTYDDLPQFVVDAFVAAEDRRFFEHPGVDYQGILRAGLNFLVSGSLSQGGSTITQQLARDYFLTRERLFTRKLREAFLAYKIEQAFTKQEIMALFVNKMFFGQRAYGVAAAAQVYFGKPLSEINVAEAATLAGVLPAPSEKNPVRSPANALQRRTYVLGRMNELDLRRCDLRRRLPGDDDSRFAHAGRRQLRAAQRTARIQPPARLSRPYRVARDRPETSAKSLRRMAGGSADQLAGLRQSRRTQRRCRNGGTGRQQRKHCAAKRHQRGSALARYFLGEALHRQRDIRRGTG
jgi:hypothetical protein